MGDMIGNALRETFINIQRIVAFVLCCICDLFSFDELTPDLDRFCAMFGGEWIAINIMDVMSQIGCLIAAILFAVICITYWLGSVIEIKDTIVSALGRLFMAWMVCLIFGQMLAQTQGFAVDISKNIEEVMAEALNIKFLQEEMSWKKFIWITSGDEEPYKKVGNDYVFASGLLEDVKITKAINTVKEQTAESIADFLLPIQMVLNIVHIIVYIIVAYFFLKLLIELVRRYVVYGALTLISPMIPGFLATSDSSQVFTMFLKMYGTQIGMVIGTRVWIFMTLCLMTKTKSGILEVFMIIAFINIGVRLEQYAKDLGLTVTGQGMALLDSVMMTGAIAMRAIGGVTKAGGGMLINTGSFAGQTGMVKMGAVLTGRPADSASVLKTMQQSVGGVAREAFGGGRIASITNSEKAEIAKLAAAGFGNNRNVNDFLANLSPEARKDALQHLLDNNYSNINGYLQDQKGGLYLEAAGNEFINGKGMPVQLLDENGVVWRDGFINSVAQGDQSIAFTGSNGEQLFFNAIGESINPDAEADLKNGVALGEESEVIGNDPTSTELKYATSFDRDQIVGEDKEASHYNLKGDDSEMFTNYNKYGAFAEGDNGYRQVFDDTYNDAINNGMDKDSAIAMASEAAKTALSSQDIVGYSNKNGLELSLPYENAYSQTYDNAYDNEYQNALSMGLSAQDAHNTATEKAGEALQNYLNEPNGYFRGKNLEVTSAKQLDNSTIEMSNGQKMASYELKLKDKTTGKEEKYHMHPSLHHRELATRSNTNDGMSLVKLKGSDNRRENSKTPVTQTGNRNLHGTPTGNGDSHGTPVTQTGGGNLHGTPTGNGNLQGTSGGVGFYNNRNGNGGNTGNGTNIYNNTTMQTAPTSATQRETKTIYTKSQSQPVATPNGKNNLANDGITIQDGEKASKSNLFGWGRNKKKPNEKK